MEEGEHTAVIVSVLVVAGMLLGVLVGRCGESGTEVLVRTTTAKSAATVRAKTTTVTRTKTITAPADTLGDTVEEENENVPATGVTGSGDDCSPEYLGACIPLDNADVTCSDIPTRDFDSVGDDPYGLDPDGDSFACET
jgi:hypothetical protein